MSSQFTFLPTWLLCRLNAVRASFPFSSLSMKRLVSFSPYLVLSLHPPHSHSRSPCSCFLALPHLHPGILLRAHWRVISCVMAALLMAWRKAVSRVACGKVVLTKMGNCWNTFLLTREQFHISFLNCLWHSCNPRWPPSLTMRSNKG